MSSWRPELRSPVSRGIQEGISAKKRQVILSPPGERASQGLEVLPGWWPEGKTVPLPLFPTPSFLGPRGGREGEQERKTPSLQTPEAGPGGTPGAPCQRYLMLCPIGTFAGGGEGIFPKKWVSRLNCIPLPASSEIWSFPKNLDGAGLLACVNYTVFAYAHNQHECIFWERNRFRLYIS